MIRRLMMYLLLACASTSCLGAVAVQVTRPAQPGDKPLPCDPISVMRRGETPNVPTRIPLMGDRYFELQRARDGLIRTHQHLVALDNEKPIAAACADSLGLYYLVPAVAVWTNLPLPKAFDSVVLAIVVGTALLSIGGFVVLFRNSVLSIAIAAVAVSLLAIRTLMIGDLVFVQSAATMAIVPWALAIFKLKLSKVKLAAFGICAGLVAGAANEIRDHSATSMLIFTIILLAFRAQTTRHVKIATISLLLLAFAVPNSFMRALVNQRDAFLRRTTAGYEPALSRHLLWHTAYVGLGYLSNPVIPGYRDEVAIDRVRAEAPDVVYMSPEYDTHLRAMVLDFVKHHKGFVITTLFAKFGVVLMFLFAGANVGLWAAALHPKGWVIESAFWSALSFNALFAFVAVPSRSYLLGFTTTAALYAVVSVDHWIRNRQNRSAVQIARVSKSQEQSTVSI